MSTDYEIAKLREITQLRVEKKNLESQLVNTWEEQKADLAMSATDKALIAQLRADLDEARKTLNYFISGAPAEAKLIADLAREKERADKLSINLREVMLDYQNVCRDRNKADRDAIAYEQRAESAESSLAALRAHADGLAKAMNETDGLFGEMEGIVWDEESDFGRHSFIDYAENLRAELERYRAFTAEGQKTP